MRTAKTPRIYSNHDLLDSRAASIYLGGETHPIALSTMALWRSKGIGPNFIRIGNSVRYHIDDLKSFIQTSCPSKINESAGG